ncbi:MAG TPA: hypothetical protein VHA78_02380 [Candidatus Peribacteraceae bacterium]|nr:hypothetical protein [Candidatus Peribacteraceae bacterium]
MNREQIDRYAEQCQQETDWNRYKADHDVDGARNATTREEAERLIRSARAQLSPFASLDHADLDARAAEILRSKTRSAEE